MTVAPLVAYFCCEFAQSLACNSEAAHHPDEIHKQKGNRVTSTAVLVLAALAFAWSMGAHYTGARMGMPYATRSIALRPALILMAIMTLIGAAFLSHRVPTHIGHGVITG